MLGAMAEVACRDVRGPLRRGWGVDGEPPPAFTPRGLRLRRGPGRARRRRGGLPAFLPVLMTSFPVISGAGMPLFLRTGRSHDRPNEPFLGGGRAERPAALQSF